MKNRIPLLLFLLLLIGCKNDDKLTFENISIHENPCDTCPLTTIEIPKALGNAKITEAINNALREEVISLLTFDDELEANTIQTAITAFNNGFKELKNRYPDEVAQWEAQIDGNVTYEDKNIITVRLRAHLFTGGAHGFNSTSFLNFNKRKGIELESWQLFEDKERFEHFAELKFRIQEDIPQGKPINSTGFMFNDNTFSLPDNIGFTQEGLQLFYEQYEVASYADGPIILNLPFNEVKNYLAFKIKP